MKDFMTSCDIGSVLIGNEDWTFAVPNIGGDGTTEVRVYDSDAEFCEDASFTKDMEFISSAQGRFGIFRYDCDFHDLHLLHEMTMTDAACVLNGRYGVYQGHYKVAFVRWEDWSKTENKEEK